jgi:arylsulfatase
MENGKLVYEYNMMIIERYTVESKDKISQGKHVVEVNTTIAKPGAPATIVINVDGKQVATGEVKRTVPAAFTASETFDVGTDLGSPVSLRYHKKAPFKFNGKIKSVKVDLL